MLNLSFHVYIHTGETDAANSCKLFYNAECSRSLQSYLNCLEKSSCYFDPWTLGMSFLCMCLEVTAIAIAYEEQDLGQRMLNGTLFPVLSATFLPFLALSSL